MALIIPSSIQVAEGGSATLPVRFDAQPYTGDVVVFRQNVPAGITVTPGSLRFTPQNWQTAQSFTVTRAVGTSGDVSFSYRVIPSQANIPPGMVAVGIPGTIAGYNPPPTIVAGDEWDKEDFQRWVLDNLQAIYNVVTAGGFGISGGVNAVFVGNAQNGAEAFNLSDGDILVGGSTRVTKLDAPGPGIKVLQSNNGVISWEDPNWAEFFNQLMRGL